MTHWRWVRSVDGADEYAFTRAEVKTEGDAGAKLEHIDSGPLWLGPKQSRTVLFRGEHVVVFDTGLAQVILRSPPQMKP